MNTNSYMDKQIMDLSQSSSPQTKEFIDLMGQHRRTGHKEEDEEEEDPSLVHGGTSNGGVSAKKDEILASYDFQPIHPFAGGLSSSQSQSQSSNFDLGGSARAWNSGDSKRKSASPVRNYGSLDSVEPKKFVQEKDQGAFESAIIAEIDKTMKKHTDNLLHALDGVSARLTQLETRTRNLENSVDDLKESAGNNHGTTDGKMRQLENILREVQSGVQVLKDKQDIVEAQLHLAKLQISKPDNKHQETAAPRVTPVVTSQPPPQQIHQHLPSPQHIPFLPPNAHPQPAPQQNPSPTPNQFPQTPAPMTQRDLYFPPPVQTQDPPNQQYQMPPQQFQPTPQLPRHHPSEEPPNPPPFTPPSGPPQPHFPQPPPQHPSEEPQYPPPGQQFYGLMTPQPFEPPLSGRPSAGPNEPYHYGGPPAHYGNASMMKPAQSGVTGTVYPHLPTARVLPHGAPAVSGGGGGSGSSGSGGGGRVPVDDVIDKVATMGFPRDHVRATVRKLTENGQSVDLNIVLDKLMNEGDGQPPRGWFNR